MTTTEDVIEMAYNRGNPGWKRMIHQANEGMLGRIAKQGRFDIVGGKFNRMITKNFLNSVPVEENAHGGLGNVRNVYLYQKDDFQTSLTFIVYTEIPTGNSVGYHTHDDNEEVYVILGGHGRMTVNGVEFDVETGDTVLNQPGWGHNIENTGDTTLKLFVFEVQKVT